MNSIKIKLIAMYAAVVLVVMIVSGTFMLIDVRNMEEDHTRERLSSIADLIDEMIVRRYDRDMLGAASAWQFLGQSEYDIESMILSELGIPIAPDEIVRQGIRPNDSSVARAVEGYEGFTVGSIGVDRDDVEQQWISLAVPVERDGETLIIFVRVNARFMNESLSRLMFTLVWMMLIALVVTIVFWFFLGSRITNPIVALTRHAKAIASGDLSQTPKEIKVKSKDEIGQLTYNFNYMARELVATLNSVSSEKNKSEAILQNSSHGVLAYDAEGSLIHANNASAELLHGIDLSKTHVGHALEFLKFDLDEVYNLRPGDVRESTYEDGEYFLSACVTTYTSQTGEIEGYVIVLQDISRQRKLDNMRKEFVANVSHELRTPLTSIRTYTETLIDGALEDKETAGQFLKVIDDEAQRMSLLISDLLELSRLDSRQQALEMDVVDLVAILRLSIRQNQVLADQKSQKIEFVMLGGPCFIEANASRINQVISNILSNSIKYSPDETTVQVSMEVTEKFYRVFFKDQGIGIPLESLGRVFERFYRVDKARARAMGGTGLGLAIVKEIMEEHGGRVYASSQPGQGTTMVLRFNRLNEA